MKFLKSLSLLLALIVISSSCDIQKDKEDKTSDNPNIDLSNNSCSVLGLNTKVVGGSSCSNLETSPVVRIKFNFVDSSAGVCTGTIVSQNKVVTAAHCFLGEYPAVPIFWSISYGNSGSENSVSVTDIQMHPNFSQEGDRAYNDVAILTLASPLPLPAIPILINSEIDVPSVGNVYGYGQRVQGNSQSSDLPESALNFNDLVSGQMLITDKNDRLYFVTYDGDGVNVCFGDSGGPLVVTRSGENLNIGVVSGGNRSDCNVGDVTSYTKFSNPQVKEWLSYTAPEIAYR